MGAQVIVPMLLILSLSLATLTQLETIAQDSSAKTIKYASDANNAIDCAYTAQPLDKCSPDLFSTDFKAETAKTQAILADLQTQENGSHLKTEADLPPRT